MIFALCNFTCVVIILITVIKCDTENFKREVEVNFNPGCNKSECKDGNINILYVKATSKDDVLHYLYSVGNFTETPSVIIVRSPVVNSTVTINYENLIIGSKHSILHINTKNYSAFGLIFTRLYEYQDNEDKADMKSNMWKVRPFKDFKWKVNHTNSEALFMTNESLIENETLFGTGNLLFKFRISGSNQYASDVPRLQYTGNNTQFDFVLNNLNTTWKESRFAIEFALINELNIGEMKLEDSKSLDDEKSPGVFRMVNFRGQDKNEDPSYSTYLQWKPVCYLSSSDKTLNYLGVASYYGLKAFNTTFANTSVISSSLAYALFGESLLMVNGSMRLLNVSFGFAKDKFYVGSEYSVWTASFGQGVPPTDSLSIAVILVIAFGLGIPFVLVVIGSIYLFIKKRLNRKADYQTIEDPIN